MATNAMNYADEILYNVRFVLSDIKARGGLASNKFLESEHKNLQGQWASDTINIALGAIGRKPAFEGKLSQAQLGVLVERAIQRNGDLVHEIAVLRAEKGK